MRKEAGLTTGPGFAPRGATPGRAPTGTRRRARRYREWREVGDSLTRSGSSPRRGVVGRTARRDTCGGATIPRSTSHNTMPLDACTNPRGNRISLTATGGRSARYWGLTPRHNRHSRGRESETAHAARAARRSAIWPRGRVGARRATPGVRCRRRYISRVKLGSGGDDIPKTCCRHCLERSVAPAVA